MAEQSKLMALPGELRDQIWGHVMCVELEKAAEDEPQGTAIMKRAWIVDDDKDSWVRHDAFLGAAVFRSRSRLSAVNRQILAEYSSLLDHYLSRNATKFHVHVLDFDFMPAIALLQRYMAGSERISDLKQSPGQGACHVTVFASIERPVSLPRTSLIKWFEFCVIAGITVDNYAYCDIKYDLQGWLTSEFRIEPRHHFFTSYSNYMENKRQPERLHLDRSKKREPPWSTGLQCQGSKQLMQYDQLRRMISQRTMHSSIRSEKSLDEAVRASNSPLKELLTDGSTSLDDEAEDVNDEVESDSDSDFAEPTPEEDAAAERGMHMSSAWDPEADDSDYSDYEYDLNSNDDHDDREVLARLKASAPAIAKAEADRCNYFDHEYGFDGDEQTGDDQTDDDTNLTTINDYDTLTFDTAQQEIAGGFNGIAATYPTSAIVTGTKATPYRPRGTKRARASNDDHVVSKHARTNGDEHALYDQISWTELLCEAESYLRSSLLDLEPYESRPLDTTWPEPYLTSYLLDSEPCRSQTLSSPWPDSSGFPR